LLSRRAERLARLFASGRLCVICEICGLPGFGTIPPMKLFVALFLVIVFCPLAFSQSGRRGKEIKAPVPPPVEQPATSDTASQSASSASSVTAERNQDYRCTGDGTLERIIDTEGTGDRAKPRERILSSKETDSRVEILSKPQPTYSKEARRNGIQGFVSLKVLLSGHGKASRIRVLKGLPDGLTENAIRAACKMKFKPAVKDGAPVSQWVFAEYLFRLANSSILRR